MKYLVVSTQCAVVTFFNYGTTCMTCVIIRLNIKCISCSLLVFIGLLVTTACLDFSLYD